MSDFSLKKIFKDKRAMGLDVAMLVLVLLFSLCSIVTCVTLLRYDRDDAENESIQEKSKLQMVGENFVEYVRMHADESYEETIDQQTKDAIKIKFGGNFMPSASAYDIPATFKTAINQVKSLSFYALTENGAKDVLNVTNASCDKGLVLRSDLFIDDSDNATKSLKTYKPIDDKEFYFYPSVIDLSDNASVPESGKIELKGFYISDCPVYAIGTRVSDKAIYCDGANITLINYTNYGQLEAVVDNFDKFSVVGTGVDFTKDNVGSLYFYSFSVTKTFSGGFDYDVVALCGSQYVTLWSVSKGTPAADNSRIVFNQLNDYYNTINFFWCKDNVKAGNTSIKDACSGIDNSNVNVTASLGDYAGENLNIHGWFVFAKDADTFGYGEITDFGYSINSTSVCDIIQSGSFNNNPGSGEIQAMKDNLTNTAHKESGEPRRFNITAPILQGNNTYYFYVRTGDGRWDCFYTITNTDSKQLGCVDWVKYGSDETVYSSGHSTENLVNGKATWTIDATDLKDNSFEVRGWYGYVGPDGIKAFGYSIDDGCINYKSATVTNAESGVKDAIVSHCKSGNDNVDYDRFKIYVPYSGGCHTIHIYVNILGMDVEIFRYNLTDKRAVLKEGTYREYGEVTDVSIAVKSGDTTKTTGLNLVNYSTLDFASFTTGADKDIVTLEAKGYYANYYNVNSFGYCFEYEDTYYEITAGIDLDENYVYDILLETYNGETVKTLKIYEQVSEDTKEIKLVVSVSMTTLDIVRWYCEKGVIES